MFICGQFSFINLGGKLRKHKETFFDTPRDKSPAILGSTKPLNLESLRHLNQRWDSPQALIRVCPTLFALASPVWFETICFKILIRLAPMNLLPTARRKLEQCSRTA